MASGGGYDKNRRQDSASSDNQSRNTGANWSQRSVDYPRNQSGQYDSYGASSSDDHSRYNSNDSKQQQRYRTNSYDQPHSNNPDERTLYVVDEFKRIIQDKIEARQPINGPVIELDIANIRRKENPNQYDLNEWKRRLPHNVQNCPDSILRLSMAYADDPNHVETVLQAKMNKINLNDSSADTSLDNITEPLKRLKKDLDQNPPPNLFRAVRNTYNDSVDRADRLFLSEVFHIVPAIKEYSFDDAHDAVQAIHETTYEINQLEELLPIIKTSRNVEDTRSFIKTQEAKQKQAMRAETITTASNNKKNYDDDHRTTSYSTSERRNPNNNNPPSNFYIKPTTDHFSSPSSASGQSSQGHDNKSREGASGGTYYKQN